MDTGYIVEVLRTSRIQTDSIANKLSMYTGKGSYIALAAHLYCYTKRKKPGRNRAWHLLIKVLLHYEIREFLNNFADGVVWNSPDIPHAIVFGSRCQMTQGYCHLKTRLQVSSEVGRWPGHPTSESFNKTINRTWLGHSHERMKCQHKL